MSSAHFPLHPSTLASIVVRLVPLVVALLALVVLFTVFESGERTAAFFVMLAALCAKSVQGHPYIDNAYRAP